MLDLINGILPTIILQASEAAKDVLNETESVKNATDAKVPATKEGKALAYVSLVLMSVGPILIGSFKSVKHHANQKERSKTLGEQPETMTGRDAAMFPFIASGALLGLYIVFKVFSKEYVNLLLTGYFFLLGMLALTHILSPIFSNILPACVPRIPYHLKFTKGASKDKEVLLDFSFNTVDIVCIGISSILGVWYLLKKHWIANNLFGIAFAINGVELLHLNSVLTGCILLGGLFVYDIFWVFGTDVMVTVAKSFEAPIKLIFPQDFIEKGIFGTNFAMLGLGDIVIPGIFIALLLRFDKSLNRKYNVYFHTSFIAYILGLVSTIAVLTIFNHAQPALLYLVPACVGLPLTLALVRGDIKTMFQYQDHPEEEKDASKKDE